MRLHWLGNCFSFNTCQPIPPSSSQNFIASNKNSAMALQDICINLLQVADDILASTDDAHSNSYMKNGRKYRMTNGGFVRVQEEDKSLVIEDGESDGSTALFSAYTVLSKTGSVLVDYPDLCLSIMMTAREIERQKWYESNTKVVDISESTYDPFALEDEAREYLESHTATADHLKDGCSLLAAAKINFFHTDHHVGKPKLQGIAMRKVVTKMCGHTNKCLKSEDVYNAVRAFVHWCSIRGVLHCLGLRTISIESELEESFKSFPEQPEWICESLKGRYPAGTSQYMLVKKSLTVISHSTYGALLSIPPNLVSEIHKFWKICEDIETSPEQYHIRSKAANLSLSPVTLSSLPDISRILTLCGCVFHGSKGKVGSNLVLTSKFPKRQTIEQSSYHERVRLLNSIIEKNTELSEEELIEKIGEMKNSFKQVIGALLEETD
ncbi:unnamed protein product [Kuraishia capsulata CBS 1993]|uniref:Uncharacterized protein n=1 Tax=Kuraishia capsulata CBS 1993 TaxID=1382522 RepID=W6MJP0_9ASCO|nr:uncharacterized protein KUCA_T00002174001 [Kuraishia capsulata CBS 1993]CDK26203.1 unnamed protein product [Kuraishia capsulata CBS 1993]